VAEGAMSCGRTLVERGRLRTMKSARRSRTAVLAARADDLNIDNRVRAELARLLDDLLDHFLHIAATE